MTGAELKRWVDAEIAREREQRAQTREDAKAQAEQDRLRLEAEERVLKLKIELQEKTGSTQGAATDASAGQALARAAPDIFSPHKLIPPLCLTGEALTVIGRLDSNAATDYDQLKATLLQRFRYTAEGYREKFRNARPEDNETAMQYAGRISGYFDHWIEMSQTDKSFDSLRDAMIGEQFLESCSMPLRVFLKERNCKTLDALAKNADCFIEAQHLTNMSKEKTLKEATVEHSDKAEIPKTSRSTDQCFLCDKAGHRASECWSQSKGHPAERGWSRRSGPGVGPSKQETGQASCMMAPSPPKNPTDEGDGYVVLQSGETIPIVNTTLMPPTPGCDVAKLPVRRGFLESQPVSVLRDTGCNTVVVRHSLIPREKMTGTTSPVFLLDRTIHYLPEAVVFLDTPFFTGLARVKCMRDPLYDVVLGNIEGARPPNDPASLLSPNRTRSDTKEEDEEHRSHGSGRRSASLSCMGGTRVPDQPYPGPLPCWATFQTNRRRAFVPTHAWTVGDSIAAPIDATH
ncbi:hypothetical protein HPB52_003191 [Rhipicephalus sanguineus]|uniref:CCHC-type domain-containing protein n=1 Tax=Rhipicephalus sanguineus TaxID=34632 RepID=A0A9D4PBJ3_RHISA|nr:hypothetical protein HPB52_003191 [Rhipicephalus sanguineus]